MFKTIPLNTSLASDTKLLLIYTGGTLGMVSIKESSPLVPMDFEDLMEHIPELERLECQINVKAMVQPLDSSDMNPSKWVEIGKLIHEDYDKYDGFVIIHGTDTMVYTAAALSFMFENLDKPIILTGSQMPLGLNRSDARNNLITSLEIARMKRDNNSYIKEVCIFFDNLLLRGNRTKKIESDQFDAFHSENYPSIAEAGVDININDIYLFEQKLNEKLIFRSDFSHDVFNWKIFPGMRLEGISNVIIEAGFKGVIIETYGSGNAPTDEGFLNEIDNMSRAGIYILNVSQCLGGSVKQGRYATSKKLDEFGVISGKDITSEAAIVKMMYLIGNYSKESDIRDLLKTSIRGEISL